MSNTELDTESKNEPKRARGKGVWVGLTVITVGLALLSNGLNLALFPSWLFRWPLILIMVGIIAAIKSNFANPGWLVLIIVGSFFMVKEMHLPFFETIDLWKFGPAVGVILVGLFIIIRSLSPRSSRHDDWHDQWRRSWHRRYDRYKDRNSGNDLAGVQSESTGRTDYASASGEDYFDVVNIFGGSTRRIFSKKFKSGENTNFFGGTNLDLSQADIEGEAVLDLTCIFGGVKLIVPSNWQIESDITTIMGGLEDKRTESAVASTPGKKLILTGVCICGGVEIKNFY